MKSDFQSMNFQRPHSPGIKSTQSVFHTVTKGKALKYGDKSDLLYLGKWPNQPEPNIGEWQVRQSVSPRAFILAGVRNSVQTYKRRAIIRIWTVSFRAITELVSLFST